jgi:hypothetical protein
MSGGSTDSSEVLAMTIRISASGIATAFFDKLRMSGCGLELFFKMSGYG